MGTNIVDFSIIIPTFNRAELLRKAISSVLRQEKVTIELVVGDNASTDNTEEIIKKFKDKRIKYFKNKKNLGFPGNIKKCFKKSRGKYVFTLGDDDLILDKETLFDILKIMEENSIGVGSIGTIYWSKSLESPCKIFKLSDRKIIIKPRKDKKLSPQVLDFNISFFSGLILNRSIIDTNKITTSFTYAYFPFVYDAVLKKGITYIPNHFLVGCISQRFVPQYYNIKNLGSFYMEDYLKMIKFFLTKNDFENHKRKFLQESTILLPSIKLFTNIHNYLEVLDRFIKLDRSLILNLKFILFTLVGFLPDIILNLMRSLIIYVSEKKTIQFAKKVGYFQELQDLRS